MTSPDDTTAAAAPRTPSRQVGTQTLARGLHALQLVARGDDGASVQDVAAELGIHRTVAYRLLATLDDFGLVTRGGDGKFRTAAGLLALANSALSSLREIAMPHLRDLADDLGATVSLLVAEGGEAVAIAVVEPTTTRYRISFHEGSRHPLSRGSAGIALMTTAEPRPGDSEEVARARDLGYSRTQGQVEPGAFGVAVPLPLRPSRPASCVNVITFREEVADRAPEALLAAVARIDQARQ